MMNVYLDTVISSIDCVTTKAIIFNWDAAR